MKKLTLSNTRADWKFSLEKEGFQVEIMVPLPNKKTLVLRHTMSWQIFIQGLAIGWKRHLQKDVQLTQILNTFIEDQIELGNYNLEEQVLHGKDQDSLD